MRSWRWQRSGGGSQHDTTFMVHDPTRAREALPPKLRPWPKEAQQASIVTCEAAAGGASKQAVGRAGGQGEQGCASGRLPKSRHQEAGAARAMMLAWR